MLGVIVLMGGLLAYGANITASMAVGVAGEVASVRAQQAANAGIEWARFNITQGGGACVASTSFAPPFIAAGTTVTVNCQLLNTTSEGTPTPVSVSTYRVTATACNRPLAGACPNNGATGDYVQAQLSTLVRR
jgi:MSHA biogenesis protein MshP